MAINAQEFDRIAREVFAPIYPVIAGQILRRTGITRGHALDVGCGSGYLGLALAGQSDLELTLFDQSEDMLSLARKNITDRGLDDRVWTLHGDVARIPLPDNSTNLAVSRGSVFFWDKPALAFAEIHRVLAPGGRAVIGGGFGSAELKEQISRTMEARDKEPGQWRAKLKRNLSTETAQTYESALREAGVTDFGIELSEETGFWITIGK
jgi:ubiquinone/menaquinone biosynthesis C-methylase UbiE